MKIEVATAIAAPPDTVFAVMTDIARWAEIMRGVEKVELLTEGPMRAGTRCRETRTIFGRSATEEMTVAEIDPPRRLVFTAGNHGTRYLATHTIEPTPGGSRLILTFKGTPITLAARLFSLIGMLFTGALRRQLESDLADIKAEAERRSTT